MKDLLKLVACWFAIYVSLMVGGAIATALHLPLLPAGQHVDSSIAAVLAGAAVLVAGLYPIACGLAGSRMTRGLAVGGFVFVALGLNTVIEARVFSSVLTGVVAGNLLMYVVEAAFVGTAFALCFGGGQSTSREWRPGHVGRAVVAWLGWPVIYFAFGMCIAPIVMPYYQSGAVIGLHIPPMGVVVGTQLVRSVPFLFCSLPLIVLWKGSRRSLWLALGLAHAVAVGLSQMLAATFLPMVLRVTHGAEITCDSFAYAGLLVLLFGGANGVRNIKSQEVSRSVS